MDENFESEERQPERLPDTNAKFGSATRWRKDEKGNWVMPPHLKQFLDWMMSDNREPKTQQEWCRQTGWSPDSITNWKNDKRFIEKWEEAARAKNISIDRVQSVVDAIYASAAKGDIKAASLYLQYVDRFTPTQRVVTEDERVSVMSDKELESELRALLDG